MIEVRPLERDQKETWDSLVDRSPQSTPFHRYDVLSVLAEHSNATLYPLVGYKGQEPVGIFPWFEIARGPISTIFSPPPSLKVSYLGPALINHTKLKQRKAERRNREFIEGCLEALDRKHSPRYVHVRTAHQYTDGRPFIWNEFEATPVYTYLVDLSVGEDALFDRFSSDARRNIRAASDGDCTVREGGVEAARKIIMQVKKRHDEQGESYKVTPEFVADLFERSPEGTVRPYMCTVDDTFAGGMVALELGDTIYRWQGGARPDTDLQINEYIDWRIMVEAMNRGLEVYDLVGAVTPRLCEYKSKFGPDLSAHLNLRRGTKDMKLAANVYKRLR